MKKIFLTILIFCLIGTFCFAQTKVRNYNVYKLSFESEKAFNKFKETFVSTEEIEGEMVTKNPEGVIQIKEIGHLSFPAIKDEEGNIVTEAGFYEDWAVDILTEEVLFDELTPYLIEPRDNFRHSFNIKPDRFTTLKIIIQ